MQFPVRQLTFEGRIHWKVPLSSVTRIWTATVTHSLVKSLCLIHSVILSNDMKQVELLLALIKFNW